MARMCVSLSEIHREWSLNKTLVKGDYIHETLIEQGYKHDEKIRCQNTLVISRGDMENVNNVREQMYAHSTAEAPSGLLVTPSKEATYRIVD